MKNVIGVISIHKNVIGVISIHTPKKDKSYSLSLHFTLITVFLNLILKHAISTTFTCSNLVVCAV